MSTTNYIYGELKSESIFMNNSYKLPIGDGTPAQVLQTDGSGTASWTTINLSSGSGNIIFVSITGSDTDITRGGHVGNIMKPFLTLESARDAAISGDTIHVFPGIYTVTTTDTNGLAKDGVRWHFNVGCILNKTVVGHMFGGTGFSLPLYISGSGNFYGSVNSGCILFNIPASSMIQGIVCSSVNTSTISSSGQRSTFQFSEIISTAGTAVSNLGSYNLVIASSIRSTANYAAYNLGAYSEIRCSEFTSSAAWTYYGGSNVTINANYIIGNTYGVYSDGNVTVNCNFITGVALLAGVCDFNGIGSTLYNSGGQFKGGYFNNVSQFGVGTLETRLFGSNALVSVSGGRADVYFDSVTTSASPRMVLTGGVCVIDGKWIDDDGGTGSTISAGTLIIKPSMTLELGPRQIWLTMTGTSIVDLSNCKIKFTSTNFNYGNLGIRFNGGTLISNGATIITASNEIAPIVSQVPGMNIKILSGGFNTNYVNPLFSVLGAKKKKCKIIINGTSNTTFVVDDLTGQETFNVLVSGFPTTPLIAQQLVTLINASVTLDVIATQDIPGTDNYLYIESDVAGVDVDVINSSLVNISWQVIRANSYSITNNIGGTIIPNINVSY